MTWVQFFLAAALGAAFVFASLEILSAWRLKTLRWPASLGYYGFRRLVMRYLRRSGWTLDKQTVLQVDFFAVKKRNQFAVICLPSTMEVTGSRLRDMASLPSSATRSSPIVCVTQDKVSAQYVQDAAINNIRIIWYKDLASF